MKTLYIQSFIILLVMTSTLLLSQTNQMVMDSIASQPVLDISGSVDVYYRANLNGDFDTAPGTSFANLPGFSLGMANLVVSKESAKVGVTADLVFGPRGEDATFLSPFLRPGGTSSIVNQLYAYWNITDAITVTIGNFNTYLGYEVISPAANYNYSTSYMFSYGPFSHTGLKLDFSLGGGFSLMAGVFNPTDATEYNPSNDYAAGLQLGYDNDAGLGVYLNALLSEDFYQLDLTAGYEVTDALYLGVNATTAQESFYGFAGYLQYVFSDAFSMGTRVEYFSDQGLGLFTLEENVLDATLSAQYSVGDFTLIPEIRIDVFSEAVVPDGDQLDDSLASFVLAGVYAF